MEKALDSLDWQIISQLQRDGSLSYNQLGRLVHFSAPAVADRVRRLEESGVITGYQAKVDPAKAGLPLTAFVQLRCALGSCLLRTTSSRSSPRWSRSTSSPATGARS